MIYVFLANGFEEVEALAPVDMLRRAKQEVTTVGVTGKIVTGSHHIPVTADITAEELQIGGDMDMIVLPGGMPGTLNEEASPVVQAAIDYCVAKDRCDLCRSLDSGTQGRAERKDCYLLYRLRKGTDRSGDRQRRCHSGRQDHYRTGCRRGSGFRSGTGGSRMRQGNPAADSRVHSL